LKSWLEKAISSVINVNTSVQKILPEIIKKYCRMTWILLVFEASLVLRYVSMSLYCNGLCKYRIVLQRDGISLFTFQIQAFHKTGNRLSNFIVEILVNSGKIGMSDKID